MTRTQRAFLTLIRDNYFNVSEWLAADGKEPTGPMQRLAFLGISANGQRLQISTEELKPIEKLFTRSTVNSTSLVLTAAGRAALEAV